MSDLQSTQRGYLLRELNIFGFDRLAAALDLEHHHFNASLISFDDLLGYPVPNDARDGLQPAHPRRPVGRGIRLPRRNLPLPPRDPEQVVLGYPRTPGTRHAARIAAGPTIPIGGGAWSEKDFHNVDRLGGMLDRELAMKAVLAGVGREVLVTLEYTPGCDGQSGVSGIVDGRPVGEELVARIGAAGLSNLATWDRFGSSPTPLPVLARWGHQASGESWE